MGHLAFLRHRAWILLAVTATGMIASCSAWRFGQQRPDPELARRLRDHVEVLSSTIGERNREHRDGLDQARDYIRSQFESLGYPTALLAFEHDGEAFHNVEAVLHPGATSWIIVGAHYDSVPGSPGADDNASGVAALLEIARAMRPLQAELESPFAWLSYPESFNVGVRFVAFTNEEPPYFNTGEGMGSVEYIRQLPFPLNRVDAMVALDAIGYYRDAPGSQGYPEGQAPTGPTRGNFAGFVGDLRARRLVDHAWATFSWATGFPAERAVLPASVRQVYFSDHRSFANAGIPSMMVTDTALFRNPNYHRESDTAAELDYDRLSIVTMGLSAVACDLRSFQKKPF